jgi:two-component system, response regulator YesN
MPTVLVIDENRGALDAIGRVLRGAGFKVALASTGREGLRLAQRRTIDLVVADLRLADITGMEVLKRLRQELVDIPVIVTGLASTASALEAGKLGAADYVEKPVFPDRLVDIVRSYAPGPSGADAGGTKPPIRANSQIIKTMRAIEERYADASLHVGTVAHDLGVSTEHLCRVIKRQTGLTFVMLLRRARVRAACRLLQTTTLSMKEIAGRVGFSSASRFDNDFKTVCGVSPSAYRADVWRQPRPFDPTS